jgi:asparagine synthase (glutamine-hydrolysing)
MCGFAGVINKTKKINNNQLKKLASEVDFRGPDFSGIEVYDRIFQKQDVGQIGLFHNRLAIIDLDQRSNQPFEDESYVLLYNGEIYNFEELKSDLVSKGIIFKTKSDTEVLFEGLKYYKDDFIQLLNGIFSFVFIDKLNMTALMSRDRLGIKPLYYYIDSEQIIFSSEMNTVIRLKISKNIISRESIDNYMLFQYIPTPMTMIENIYKVKPGYVYNVSLLDNKLSYENKYWDAFKSRSSSNIQNLENFIYKSLKQQLVADVDVGMFLSSGIDSSLLVAMVDKYFSDKKYKLFTVSFDKNSNSDESDDAKEFVKGFNQNNFEHVILQLDSNTIKNRLINLYDFIDEPFADSAVLLNMAISEEAKKYSSVVLSGDGADELFFGYDRYLDFIKFKNINLLKKYFYLLVEIFIQSRRLFLSSITDSLELSLQLLNITYPKNKKISQKIKKLFMYESIENINNNNEFISKIDLKSYLTDAMLYKVDRSSMANSLEVRVPFLDNEVLDFALSSTFEEKFTKKLGTKSQLKELLSKLAPHYKLYSTKKGFSFPLLEWLQNDWKDLVLEKINKENLQTLNLDSRFYINLVEEFYQGKCEYTNQIWFVLNLVLWFEAFSNIEKVKYT